MNYTWKPLAGCPEDPRDMNPEFMLILTAMEIEKDVLRVSPGVRPSEAEVIFLISLIVSVVLLCASPIAALCLFVLANGLTVFASKRAHAHRKSVQKRIDNLAHGPWRCRIAGLGERANPMNFVARKESIRLTHLYNNQMHSAYIDIPSRKPLNRPK